MKVFNEVLTENKKTSSAIKNKRVWFTIPTDNHINDNLICQH